LGYSIEYGRYNNKPAWKQAIAVKKILLSGKVATLEAWIGRLFNDGEASLNIFL